MKVEYEKTDKEIGLYSIDKYKGKKKWCFAIVLNKAQTNLMENQNIFEQTLTKYERIRKQDWYDKETKKIIYEKEDEYKVKEKIKNSAGEILKNLRNYFSHHFHKQDLLIFSKDDKVRIVMERAYERSKYEKKKNLQEDISIEFPDLFEKEGKITTAGVLFFVSFFVERRFLNRLMGYVEGFKKTEGEYNITREVFATYCLRDSYSVQAQDKDAVMFRDIMGYLSRVPTESFQRIKKPQKQNESRLSERKTDKFISFALNYLEDYGFKDLKNYTAFFARSRIKKENEGVEITDEKKYQSHRMKAKVEIHFDEIKESPFYIKRNNVILKIHKKDGRAHILRMGIYELKYLALLCLSDKANESVEKIDDYLNDLHNQLPNIERIKKEDIKEEQIRFLPGFVRSRLGLLQIEDERKIRARLDYVKAKWLEKKEKSKELELHRKGRDILRYINERCEKPLTIEKYNHILELLVIKDMKGFYDVIEELRKTGRLNKSITQALHGQRNLNDLHIKACDLVLDELGSLEKEELKKYIGLTPKEEKEMSFKEKLDRIIEQPVINKGFLREQFFRENKKSFARLVEEALKEKAGGLDVPLGTEYYNIPSLDRFYKDNKKLYETMAIDRLCLMMAKQYYLSLNKKLVSKAQNIEWNKENGKDTIIFTFKIHHKQEQSISIRFSPKDYAKLYVIDEPEFLAKLCYYFYPKETEIDYHKLYSQGINKYTNLQKEGVEAILELERKIIERKKIRPLKNYLSFKEIKEIMDKNIYNKDEQEALGRVRNSLLHYQINFEKRDLKRFYEIMKRECIEKRWSLAI